MSKTMQKKINDVANQYAKQFKKLNGIVNIIRQTPGMYIGSLGKEGLKTMIREIFQNSGDQLMRKDSPCDTIFVNYNEAIMETTVQDNGLGIPFYSPDFEFNISDIFISEHLSTNYVKEPFQFTSGLHGIGSKATNVLSEYFIVESFGIKPDGEAVGMMCKFEEGQLVIDDTPIPNPDKIHGLRVTFKPSEFMKIKDRLTSSEVMHFIQSLVPQLEIGAKVVFHSNNIDGSCYDETFVNEDGIFTHLYMATTNPLLAPIRITDNVDGVHKVDMVITYDLDSSSQNIITFANTCPVSSDQSTVSIGAVNGFVRFFKNYMTKVYLAGNKSKKKTPLTILPSDIRSGLLMAISAFHLNPVFKGQDKNTITNEDFIPYMDNLVFNGLTEWAKLNPKELQKAANYIKEVAELRMKTEAGKTKITNKFQQSSITGLPKKFIRPTSQNPADDLELWIVEGDSVAGQTRVARNRQRQGIMPIRGKIINAMTSTLAKVLDNQEVQAIITILNAGYGKNFDIIKCIYSKVIFGTDADADGAHIRNLLLILFMVLFLQMVEHGRVYKAVPPLYGLKIDSKQFKYFTNKMDYIEFNQERFSKNYIVSTLNNVVLSEQRLIQLIFENILYLYEMHAVTNVYAIDPYLLELVLVNRNKPIDEIRHIIKSKQRFRFVNVDLVDGHIQITGLVDRLYNTLYLNDKLLYECRYIIELIDVVNEGNIFYKLNDQAVSIYHIMSLYQKVVDDSPLQRYKGLGEMNANQLFESTMDPYGDRTLIQYNVESAKKEIQIIKNMESDRAKLASSIKVTRSQVIGG